MRTATSGVPDPGVITRIGPRVDLVLAPNSDSWTFEGTNTWIVGERTSDTCAVIDPGPDDASHMSRILEAAAGRNVAQVWLTHGHRDHAESAGKLSTRTGARIHAVQAREGQQETAADDLWMIAGLRARALPTPGHTADSLCLDLLDDGVIVTGDTLLGRGSPFVPPGLMGHMMASLEYLHGVVGARALRGLPGHGPIIADLRHSLGHRLTARRQRIADVADLVESGVTDIESIVDALYAHVDDPRIFPAARQTVISILMYLEHPEGLGVNAGPR